MGRSLKFGEPSCQVKVRVPVSLADELKKQMEQMVEERVFGAKSDVREPEKRPKQVNVREPEKATPEATPVSLSFSKTLWRKKLGI